VVDRTATPLERPKALEGRQSLTAEEVVALRERADRLVFMGSSDGLHLIERFTRVAADTIDYHMTIADEAMWTKSWTALVPLKKTSARLYEFGCHEGNAEVMRGMLNAARADEKSVEETAKKKTR